MSLYGQDIGIPKTFVQLASGVPSGTITITQTSSRPCRGLLVGTAGICNVVMETGTTLTGVPFIQGLNPGAFKALSGSSNTIANVWAVF